MVKETNKVLRVSNASADWRSYVDFINNIVVDGLSKVPTYHLPPPPPLLHTLCTFYLALVVVL